MIRRNVFALALLASVGAIATASAATIVAPSASSNTPGNAQGPAPLRYFGAGGSRVQQVYDSSTFAGVSGPVNITAISFRPFTTPSAFAGNTVSLSDSLIRLSTTQGSGEGANQLQTTFASNVGGNEQTVYSGSLTLTTSASGAAPYPFDYTINLQNPFTYDPAQGNLLLDVQIPATATVSGAGFGFATFDTANTENDGLFSVVEINSGDAIGGQISTAGAITQFTYAAVPEPSTLTLMIAGMALISQLRRFPLN
ncbi:MAG: PEP-CTERM sorting domain-containing protein [Planctomycetaceae bacterium]|nr:PEP-CTERM sorting domain-containing protein [Planctomycetaceae bacterium]